MAKTTAGQGTPSETWVPSRKWVSLVISGLGAIATSTVTTHGWGDEEWLALITLAVGSAVSYLIPNG